MTTVLIMNLIRIGDFYGVDLVSDFWVWFFLLKVNLLITVYFNKVFRWRLTANYVWGCFLFYIAEFHQNQQTELNSLVTIMTMKKIDFSQSKNDLDINNIHR